MDSRSEFLGGRIAEAMSVMVNAAIADAVFEQERKLMNLKAGQYIRHSKYGCGTIVTRDSERTTVDFDTAGTKLFVTGLAAFEMAEGAPPAKKRTGVRRRAKAAAVAN